MNRTADAVVIGGGILGCCTAVQLAMQGVKRVVLLEKGAQVAVGASGASGGLVRMHYTNPGDVRLAWRSLHWWQNWKEWVGEPSPFVNSGFVQIVGRDEVQTHAAIVKLMQEIGVDAQIISMDDLKELVPGISTDDLGVASYEPQSGFAYPPDAVQGLAVRARALGVEVLLNTAATRIVTQSGRITGVETSDGLITAGAVVLAAGAWSGKLAEDVGLKLEQTPKRSMAANSGWPSGAGRHPVIIDQIWGLYMRNDRNQRDLFGLEPLEPKQPLNPDDPNSFELTPGALEAGLAKVQRRLTFMARSNDPVGWAAPEAYTADNHAILGAVPDRPGLFLATGGTGSNFKTGPAIGEAIAQLVVSGRCTHVDLSEFRASRFAEGKPIVAPYQYGPDIYAGGLSHG
ncbi:MAG: FAD-binding oxidoreductase [Chloroflexi bacterium]|nr:FAD-binding oxidoreductase [Chloroflexota bacterium]